jgi:cold-inducible RNA-binding protein
MGNKLYVGNLSYSMTDDELAAAFAEFGEVVSATVITERDSGRSKGFGFVEMSTDEEAAEAMSAMNGKELGGRTLKVDEARPRTDRRRSHDSW